MAKWYRDIKQKSFGYTRDFHVNKRDASIIHDRHVWPQQPQQQPNTAASRVCGQWPAAIGTEVEACDWQSVSRSVRCQIPIVPIVIDIVISHDDRWQQITTECTALAARVTRGWGSTGRAIKASRSCQQEISGDTFWRALYVELMLEVIVVTRQALMPMPDNGNKWVLNYRSYIFSNYVPLYRWKTIGLLKIAVLKHDLLCITFYIQLKLFWMYVFVVQNLRKKRARCSSRMSCDSMKIMHLMISRMRTFDKLVIFLLELTS